MQTAIIRTTTDKRTGLLLEERIIGIQEVSEDAYYQPLVEIIGNLVIRDFQERIGGLNGKVQHF